MFRHPLPSTGSPRVGSPASQVLRGAPTPCRPSRRTSFPSLGGTALALDVRSQGSRALLPGPGLVQRVAHPAPRARRRQGLSGSWGTPIAYMPRSLTPARSPRPAFLGVSMLPSVYLTTSALAAIIFRGSITRPAHSLCTLRRTDRSASTQHSVPAGGQPLPGGTCSPPGPGGRFQSVSITSRSPSPGFA